MAERALFARSISGACSRARGTEFALVVLGPEWCESWPYPIGSSLTVEPTFWVRWSALPSHPMIVVDPRSRVLPPTRSFAPPNLALGTGHRGPWEGWPSVAMSFTKLVGPTNFVAYTLLLLRPMPYPSSPCTPRPFVSPSI